MCVGLYTCQCGLVNVCIYTVYVFDAVVYVCQIFEEPLICCPELADNWHPLLMKEKLF